MKIAITTDAIYPFTLGGSEIRNHEIAKRLVKRGHEVHIYGGKLWFGKNDIVIDNVYIHGLSESKTLKRKSGRRSEIESLILSIKMFSILLDKNFDIIDNAAFAIPNSIMTKLVTTINKRPLVFTWHQYFSDYFLGYFGNFKGTIAKNLERFSTRFTKYNLAVSNHVKSDLIKKGIREKYITTIYNGADIKLIDSIKDQKKIYDIIFIGRLSYQKNINLLIDVINELKKNHPNIRVCLIGDGEEREQLKIKVKKLGLDNNIVFLGEIKDKKKVYTILKQSKIFVLTSLLEGFPLVSIEANACGIPVITSKTKWNNTSEYIKNNQNGFIVEYSINGFKDKINNLLKNDITLKKIQEQCKKNARPFDWEIITDNQEKYYLSLLKS